MTDSWDMAGRALTVLAACPNGLGGAVIRMRASPDRDALLAQVKRAFPDMIRLTPNVDDLHLFGGVDVAATLASGRVINSQGVLAGPRVLCMTMAERASSELAAKLCQYLDTQPTAILILLDEGADDDEKVPNMLAERLAFCLEPEGHFPQGFSIKKGSNSQCRLDSDETVQESMTVAAAQFGIDSLRAPMMALRTAATLGHLAGHDSVDASDMAEAAVLVLSHRATRLPAEETDAQPDTPPPPPTQDQGDDPSGEQEQQDLTLSRDMLVEAITASLPPELLAGLGRKGGRGSQGAGAGQKRLGNRRGRPLPARPGVLDGRTRLDILATLRAAAPWQPVRRKQTPDREGLLLRQTDFRVKRYETKSDRLVIFAVDASGSAAISRLNEAKGAIELLLSQAYSARDHVALVSFRGEGAECLLAPTRSLVQTKRKLGALPGGGGTPLAAGLQEAMQVAMQARSKGMSPVIVLVTDGKSNIALDGTPDRKQAQDDALHLAKQVRLQGLEMLVIDMSIRPQPALRNLSQHLDATYMPLPRADAQKLSGAVQSVLDHA